MVIFRVSKLLQRTVTSKPQHTAAFTAQAPEMEGLQGCRFTSVFQSTQQLLQQKIEVLLWRAEHSSYQLTVTDTAWDFCGGAAACESWKPERISISSWEMCAAVGLAPGGESPEVIHSCSLFWTLPMSKQSSKENK